MATKPKLTLEEQIAQSKLRALAAGTRVWRLTGSDALLFAAPSSTSDGTAYVLEVHPDNQGVSCTCPSGSYRGTCRHIGAVLLALDAAAQLDLATAAADADRARAEAAFPGATVRISRLEREINDLF